MSSPTVIHVVRPYSSEEEYLAHEAWTIDTRGMLLVDQEPLPADTQIVFDVQIQGGHKPIRAEAKVVGAVGPRGDRPGGLRVRFKRFGTATKAFIDRAVAAQAAPAPARVEVAPMPTEKSQPAPTAPLADRREPSGIHRKLAAPVPAPANREELLEKLRTRARTVANARIQTPGSEQTG